MKSVIIVGAGVIGLFCAIRLAKAGARVTLLEGHDENTTVWGPTVSAAAAGMLAAIAEEASPHDQIALQSFDLWRAQQAGAAWGDAVRFDGVIVASASAADAEGFAARVRSLGRDAEPLSAAQFTKRTHLRTPSPNAVLVPDEGTADPLRTLSGLAMEARALGVIIRNGVDVDDVEANKVTTTKEEVVEADVVVLAPGIWANDRMLTKAPALRHLRPARGCLIPVVLDAPLKPNLRAPGFYLAQRREDVVLGSSLEFDRTDRRVDPAQVAAKVALAEAMFPGQVRADARSWAGVRPMSPDGWPMIGPSRGGIFLAAGHSRNGWLLAPITAEIISAYVMGQSIPEAWAALSPARFETA